MKTENIIKIFQFDCFVCAMNGTVLKNYMKNKHKWTEEQFNEYLNIYRNSL